MKYVINVAFITLCLLWGTQAAIKLYERFSDSPESWTFYAESINATCAVVHERGNTAMACLPGWREKAASYEPTTP